MNTEKIATGFLKETLAVTDLLDPYVPDSDKEPSWDGNIYMGIGLAQQSTRCCDSP